MPQRGQYARDFPVLPAGAGPDARVGVRAVVLGDRRQIPREARFDPSVFQCERLAGQLADEWVELFAGGTASLGLALGYRHAITMFCRAVDLALGASAETASLGGEGADLAAVLAEWERTLPAGFAEGSMQPGQLSGRLRKLIVRRSQHEHRRVDAALLRLIDSGRTVAWGATNELDEFSRADKRALVRAAWAWINALDERLEAGWALVRSGRDPREGQWTSLADLLWAVSTDIGVLQGLSRRFPREVDRWPREVRALVAPDGEQVTRRMASLRLPGRLVAQLYPTDLDLHAYRVLLTAAAGCAPEEASGLRERDVEFLDSGVRLVLTKGRANIVRARRYLAGGEPAAEGGADAAGEARVFVDRPHREVAEIVRRLLAATERVRAHAEDPAGRLFLTATVNTAWTLRFGPWSSIRRDTSFAAWIEAAGVVISGKPEIRRMRKSTKVEKAIASGGVIAAAADDHHEQTFRGHYAQGTTLRVISGRVITSAQDHWLGKALNGPTLVTADAADALADPAQASALGLTGRQAEQILGGALDMGLADCKDPYDSPFGKPGELCAVAPLRCYECRHAFILPGHLPQQLLFLDHLERLRLRLAPVHFDARWSRSYANLRAVIAARSEAEIALAREHIEAGRSTLHLPFYADTEFDA